MKRQHRSRRRTSSLGSLVVAGMGLTLAPLSLGGCPANPNKGDAAPVQIDVERFRVELRDDDYAMGGETPLVTVVMFSDYACGPCGRTWQVLKNLSEDYGEDLRVVYRSYTVPGHLHGDRAAEAAFAAGAQGKFWDMHWRLFQDQDQFSRPSLRAHAEAIGLDVPRFFDEIDTGVHAGRRMRDRRQATELGIKALPVAFINGLFVMGAPPDEAAWHALIDEEMKRSRKMLQEGVQRPELYAAYMKTAKKGMVGETEEAERLRAERMADKAAKDAIARATLASPDQSKRYAVPTEGAASLGPDDAPVVIVEFLDFACPYCRKTHAEVLPKLREKYGAKVRIVVRHLPLEIHPVAPGAAKAAIAAGRQNEFWDFHDQLFESEGGLGRRRFVEIARGLGLDIDQFQKDMDDPEVAKQIEDDVALSRRLGVQGTPGIFVNGRYVFGARDLATYEALVDEELAEAERLAKAGTPEGELHAALMKDALPETRFPNPTPTTQATGGDD